MSSRERLQLRKDDLRAQWDLLRQKLAVLERERILETRAEEALRLEGKIRDVKGQLLGTEEELDSIEMALQDAQTGTVQAEAVPFIPQGQIAGTQIVRQSSIGVNIGQSHAPVHIHLPGTGYSPKPGLPYEPELREIPAGPFLMGSSPGNGVPSHETPQHLVQLSTFFIGRTPVTNAQYEAFVRLSGHEAPKGWALRRPPAGKNEHPVSQVSWHDAVAYCAWLREQSGRAYRLPSEAEWEKAARFTDGRNYPWGNEWLDCCCNCGSAGTVPVTAFARGASAYGCLDLLGNVREWTTTIWGSSPAQAAFSYPFAQDGRNEPQPGAGFFRIHRGGSFRDQPHDLRCAARGFSAENSKLAWCGFRVMMEGQ